MNHMLTGFHFIILRSSNYEKIYQRERVEESNISRRHGRVLAAFGLLRQAKESSTRSKCLFPAVLQHG